MSSDILAKASASATGVERRQFNMFFERMMDGFAYHKIVLDKAGKPVDYVFLEVNNAFEQLTGLKKKQIVGKRVTEVLKGIEDDPADWIGRYGRVALTGESAQFEDFAAPLDKWFKISAYCPEKGYFVALFEDITDRKKAEAEIARTALFPTLNPNPVVEVDFERKVQYANPAAKAMFGETLYSSCHEMFADWEKVIERLQAVESHTFSREITVRENTFLQSLHLVPNISRVRFYAVNIDSLKRAQNALRESEQQWATTVASIGDAVMTTDLDGNVRFLNGVAESLTGWTLAEASGKPLADIFNIINERTRKKIEPPISRALKEGSIVGLANHTLLLKKDGSEIPIDDSGAPIRNKEGKTTGMVLVFRDITERKKAEESLRRLNDELEERVEQRTAQLVVERQRLYHVLETLPAYVVLLDKDYRVPFANKVFRERFGESHGKRCYEYLFNRNSECENCETYKVYKSGNSQHWEWLGPDGHNYDIYDFPFKEADGSTLILEMGIDVTEQKRNEAELAKHREHLEELVSERTAELWKAKNDWERTFDSVPDLIAILDNNHKIVRANKAMAQSLGVKPEQAVGLPCHVCVHGTAEPPDFCPHSKSVIDEKEHIEEVYEPKIGGHFIVSTTPLHDEKGCMVGSVHVARNINERKKSEEISQKQAALINLSPDAIIVRKLEGLITFWSVGAERLYGYTKAEAVGKSSHALLRTKFPAPYNDIVEQVKQKDTWSGELFHETKDGRTVIVQSYWKAEKNKLGEISEVFESNVDITDRKEMQGKLEEYAVHLEELVQERTQQLKDVERLTAIGETAGMVGHDLRNPLQTVTGETYLAKDELKQLPESFAKRNLQENIDIIAEQISYMDKIVSDLQDFVRPIAPDKKPVNLQMLLNATLSQVNLPPNIETQIEISDNIPSILADGQLLKRVFFNLFTNAVQAMPKGGKLTLGAKKAARGKTGVIVTVQDTGEGIPENVKPKMFKPLFTTKSKGQGFGLAVCKRVIEAHGGTISFYSKEGLGTRFTVELPA